MGNYYSSFSELNRDNFSKFLDENGVEIKRCLYKDCLIAYMPCGCEIEISMFKLISSFVRPEQEIKAILDYHKCEEI